MGKNNVQHKQVNLKKEDSSEENEEETWKLKFRSIWAVVKDFGLKPLRYKMWLGVFSYNIKGEPEISGFCHHLTFEQ